MLTLVTIVLLIAEYRKNWLTKNDWLFAFAFFIVDIIDFTIAYFIFT